jgi:hypothetical protein
MSKTVGKAVREARISMIDDLCRRGNTPAGIAQALLVDPEAVKLGFDEGLSQEDLPFPTKIKMILPVVKDALRTLKTRYTLPLDEATRREALDMYVRREEAIYREAWRMVDDAFDYRDKISAARLAQDSAKNIARAMGVVLTPDPDSQNPLNLGASQITINNLGELALINGARGSTRLPGENSRPELGPASN